MDGKTFKKELDFVTRTGLGLVFKDGWVYSDNGKFRVSAYIGGDTNAAISKQDVSKLKKACSAWKGDLLFQVAGNTLTVTDGGFPLTMTLAANMASVIIKEPQDSDTIEDVGVLGAELKRLSAFAGDDPIRPFMTGVCIDSDNKSLVATNGRYLANVPFASTFRKELVIPTEVCGKIAKMSGLGIWSTWRSDDVRWYRVETDGREIIFKVTEQSFPCWKRVVPDTSSETYETKTVGVAKFLEAAKFMASQFSKNSGARTLLEAGKFGGVECGVEFKVPAYFNAHYIENTLKALEADEIEVSINCEDPDDISKKAARFFDGKTEVVVMPMTA